VLSTKVIVATANDVQERQYTNSGADTNSDLRQQWESTGLFNFGDILVVQCFELAGL
jgi:hypothetical protein